MCGVRFQPKLPFRKGWALGLSNQLIRARWHDFRPKRVKLGPLVGASNLCWSPALVLFDDFTDASKLYFHEKGTRVRQSRRHACTPVERRPVAAVERLVACFGPPH
jgi:hypothetical protein